jgi:hypothetical protein
MFCPSNVYDGKTLFGDVKFDALSIVILPTLTLSASLTAGENIL